MQYYDVLASFDLFTWIVIPLLIFLARILDVTLGTVRFVFISRGYRRLAPIVGFFEVLIWIIAIGQIMQNLSNPMCYVAYAGGFATGTYIGIVVSAKLSLGIVMIRIIARQEADELTQALRESSHGVTIIDAKGSQGPVKVIFTIVQKKNAGKVINTIKKTNSKVFYTIEEMDYVQSGVFSPTGVRRQFASNIFRLGRKGK